MKRLGLDVSSLIRKSVAALLLLPSLAFAVFPGDWDNLGYIRFDVIEPDQSGVPGAVLQYRGTMTNTTSSALAFGNGGSSDSCLVNAPHCVAYLPVQRAPIPFSLPGFATTDVIVLDEVTLNPSYSGPFPGVVHFSRFVSESIPNRGGPPGAPQIPVFGEAFFSATILAAPVISVPVPEPSTFLLGAVALLCAAGIGRRSFSPGVEGNVTRI